MARARVQLARRHAALRLPGGTAPPASALRDLAHGVGLQRAPDGRARSTARSRRTERRGGNTGGASRCVRSLGGTRCSETAHRVLPGGRARRANSRCDHTHLRRDARRPVRAHGARLHRLAMRGGGTRSTSTRPRFSSKSFGMRGRPPPESSAASWSPTFGAARRRCFATTPATSRSRQVRAPVDGRHRWSPVWRDEHGRRSRGTTETR